VQFPVQFQWGTARRGKTLGSSFVAQTLLRTPLYERHVALGARLVPFAGWEMPVQYEGVIQEHRAVRTDAGAFDVSHMGEIDVEGPRALELLQGLLSNDLAKLEDGKAQYTLLTNERGGIIDDLIVYRLSQFHYLLVVNASNKDADFRWLKERENSGSEVRDVSDEYALIAVQGPNAIAKLGLEQAPPFTFAEERLDGIECMVNRTGYTGEDGCESSAWPKTAQRCGTRSWPAASSRVASARATRSGSRPSFAIACGPWTAMSAYSSDTSRTSLPLISRSLSQRKSGSRFDALTINR